jgi:dihydroorotase
LQGSSCTPKVSVLLPTEVHSINMEIGVTTNSESGVAGDFVETYAPTFAAMEQHDIVLNLHGEVPGTVPKDNVSLEELFLPTLKRLNEKFPKLRIVLEVSIRSR